MEACFGIFVVKNEKMLTERTEPCGTQVGLVRIGELPLN